MGCLRGCSFLYCTHLITGMPASVVAPAGWAKQVAHLLLYANVFSRQVGLYIFPFMKNQVDRVLIFQVFGKPVFHLLIFFSWQFCLEGAKHLIPNDKKHTHVFIEVFWVG